MQEVVVRTSEVAWEAANGYPDGTLWKVVRRGQDGRPVAVLLKLAADFGMPAHSHVSVEHHYVISGGYESQGAHYPAGTYRLIPRHVDHGPFRSASGAELLVMWED